MTMMRNILKSMICGSLAFLVSYVTLGPIMEPANLVTFAPFGDEVAMHANIAETATQPS
jgi:hypothetical protein